MATRKVLIPLAPGFEEIEAVTLIDVLRRAGIEVFTAGLAPGPVRGAHGISIATEGTIDEVRAGDFDMIALPGGLPGAEYLRDDARVQALLAQMKEGGRLIAAICAAPIAFGPGAIAQGRAATSYPGFGDGIGCASYLEKRVVVDGEVLTSRGPGTAMEFALTLVEQLAGAERAAELERGLLAARSEPAHVVEGR